MRARILASELSEPRVFRQVHREKTEPTLIRIETPERFRSYAMFYDRYIVFLPRYNDRELYARLAEEPSGTFELSGKQYPWSEGEPTFFHDLASR